jgi:hypothetical protein
MVMVAPVAAGIYHYLTITKLFKCNITCVILLLLIKMLTDTDTHNGLLFHVPPCISQFNTHDYVLTDQ